MTCPGDDLRLAGAKGGLGTLVGTPPNALLAALMEQTYGVGIGFAQWMGVGIPIAAAMLLVTARLVFGALLRDWSDGTHGCS